MASVDGNTHLSRRKKRDPPHHLPNNGMQRTALRAAADAER